MSGWSRGRIIFYKWDQLCSSRVSGVDGNANGRGSSCGLVDLWRPDVTSIQFSIHFHFSIFLCFVRLSGPAGTRPGRLVSVLRHSSVSQFNEIGSKHTWATTIHCVNHDSIVVHSFRPPSMTALHGLDQGVCVSNSTSSHNFAPKSLSSGTMSIPFPFTR